jgi:molybdate/tungstate transport system substrate-binding protein
VKVGLADPRMDAVGYRTLMMTRLAESYYNTENIMLDTVGKYFTNRINASTSGNVSLIVVPELLDPVGEHMYLRGANMKLISLLESNDIDYTFEYKSVVAQHKLSYLELPPEINLGDINYAGNYKNVRVKLDFKRFKSVDPEFEGVPIFYGMAVPANSKHLKEATRFLEFILGANGQRIFNECSFPPLVPPVCDNINALPDALKSFFK